MDEMTRINPIANLDAIPQRIVILRALQLGDLLCAVPAFRVLRAALPSAQITLVGLPWAVQFVERFNCYLDSFIEFPGYPGLPERTPLLTHIPAFLLETQQQAFDLAIQMHGSGSIVNPLVVLLGARANAGYYLPGEYCPDPIRFIAYPEGLPEVRRHLRLMEALGIQSQGDHLEFPLTERDAQELQALPELEGLLPGNYVCIHPGARARNRRWSPERFAVVADALAAQGLGVVLTGSKEEGELTRAVAAAMRGPAIDLAGRTSLGALALLLKESRLLVSNDTGVSHVAAALHVPSVVIFSASDPARWAPLDRELHRVVDGNRADEMAVIEQAYQLLQREAALT